MPDYEKGFALLDHYIQHRMGEAGTPAVALALTDRTNTLRIANYGVANQETRATITEKTPFEIGSIGKSFTAVAIMQAFESGRLDLQAPVEAYLPWFKVQTAYAPICVHHLLTHTSGLIRGTEFSADPRSMVWALRESQTGFAPGERCYYSDIGYKILGLILQAVYRQSYAQVIQDGILGPLEMADTWPAISHVLRPHLPTGYRPLFDDRPVHRDHPQIPAPWLETDSGDGCIAATADDMAKYLRMLLNRGIGPSGAILSDAGYDLMTQGHIPGEGWIWGDYGYGLFVFERNGRKHVGHSGDMPGYEAYIAADLDKGYGIALLTSQPYPSRLVWGVLDIFQAAYLDEPLPALPASPDPITVENAADYAGLYRCGDKNLALRADGERLSLDLGEKLMPLEKRGKDTFYSPDPGYDLHLWEFGRSGVEGEAPVVELHYGPDWYINEYYAGPQDFEYPQTWDSFCGHFRSFNPWESNFRILLRKGQLLLVWPDGYAERLMPLQPGRFRVGDEETSPERLLFDQVIDGQAQRATLSNCPYYRVFTP